MRQRAFSRFRVKVPDEESFEEQIACENACPVNTRASHYISAIAEGDYDLAFQLNRADNLFPAILGRICVHPCEGKCRRGIQMDLPPSICSLKRAAADHRSLPPSNPLPASRRGRTLAVIGAGPSGLSAANDLAKLGYEVTIYEACSVTGDMFSVVASIPRKTFAPSQWVKES